MAENQQLLEIELALIGLVKLMKALRFYPKGHPSLRTAIDEGMASFRPLLIPPGSRAIQVNQNGFSLDEQKIGETNQALPELARLLAERRVNQIIFLPDLPPRELLTLLEGLSTPPEEIYKIGGLPVFLRDNEVASIWLNESSLEGAMKKRQELTEEQHSAAETGGALKVPEELERSDLAQQLRDIVEQLNSELHDDAYSAQIDKLLSVAPGYFSQTGLPGILRILPLLLQHSQQEDRNRLQRGVAAGALDRLLTDQAIEQILSQLRKTSLTPQQFQRLQKFIVALGTRIAPHLLNLMSAEEDGTMRKRLTALLGRMGEPLLDLLRETVHSNKWYVVRNAVTLLGDLRLESGISILSGLTSHQDQRIRRALIRSLAMIGGSKAVPPLQKLTLDPIIGLRRPAVKALGATQSFDATAPLLAIAQRFDPFGRQIEIRTDAVSALATLNNPKAVAPLLALANRTNLLRLRRLEELRAETILTLGKLGDERVIPALERWRRSPQGTVQRAAEQSLAILTKKNDNNSAD